MPTDTERDAQTGIETTGHEWDGIKELNRPLPKWWIYIFYATIAWSIVYYVLYPAIPWINSHTTGVLDYSSRKAVAERIDEARAAQAQYRDRIAALELPEIRAEQAVFNFAMAGGKAAFADNCAPCHGSGGGGSTGYPSLIDDAWLWGGSLDEIHTTLLYGIRADHPDTRQNDMLAFGRDGLLGAEEIDQVAEYVLSLSGRAGGQTAAEAGKSIFADQCSGCHGEDGTGIAELGAPNLTDAIWLYGGEKADIVASLNNGRAGVMPAWSGRLDDTTIKMLAVYVHALGGGN